MSSGCSSKMRCVVVPHWREEGIEKEESKGKRASGGDKNIRMNR